MQYKLLKVLKFNDLLQKPCESYIFLYKILQIYIFEKNINIIQDKIEHTYCWNCCNNFAKFKFVKNGSFSSSIKPNCGRTRLISDYF